MSKRSSHVTKSRNEKAAYVDYIRHQDYEPTKDESIDFHESTKRSQDYSISNAKKVNRLTTSERLGKHFSEHWINWLMAGVGFVIVFFVVKAQISFSNIDLKLDFMNKEIDEVKSGINEIERRNHQQDMDIQKNQILIDESKKKPNEKSQK